MPDSVTHHYFGHRTLERLPAQIQDRIDPDVFDRALQGPDPWSTVGFYGGKSKRYASRSGIMHKEHTGEYLVALARAAKEDTVPPTFSILTGTICHYCLDRLAHPYIICRGGDYDGTAATLFQKGGHVRLERAIDCWVIRYRYGKIPWHFSIPREILRLNRYPECLRKPLNQVLHQVYGWENAFDQLNESLIDERRFYSLMQDPTGIIHYLLRPLSCGRTNYCMYSYYRRDAHASSVDYLNEKHSPWHHPYDSGIQSNASFFDLFDQALEDAVEMIKASYLFVFQQEDVELEMLYGNSNYSTGFDCDDPRNQEKPVYEPLDYGMKYFNVGK